MNPLPTTPPSPENNFLEFPLDPLPPEESPFSSSIEALDLSMHRTLRADSAFSRMIAAEQFSRFDSTLVTYQPLFEDKSEGDYSEKNFQSMYMQNLLTANRGHLSLALNQPTFSTLPPPALPPMVLFPNDSPSNFRSGPIMQLLENIIIPIHSFSSNLMSQLITVRNTENQSDQRKIWHFAKVAVTEMALPVVTVAAAVETAVYSLLHFGAKALKPLTERPLEWITKNNILERKESSAFTIWWSVNMLYHNLSQQSLPNNENEARDFLQTNLASI